MSSRFLISVFMMWLVLMLLEAINNHFRNELIYLNLSQKRKNQIAAVIFMLIVLTCTFVYLRMLKINVSDSHLLFAGLTWAGLSFLLKSYLAYSRYGNDITKSLTYFNVKEGQPGLFVLIIMALAPWLMGKI